MVSVCVHAWQLGMELFLSGGAFLDVSSGRFAAAVEPVVGTPWRFVST